jgi:hypothetical protein
MKRIGKTLLKVLLLVVLFTGTSLVLSTTGIKTVSEAKAAVTDEQVLDYLQQLGYKVVKLKQVNGSDDWIAYTCFNGSYYKTTVHVQGDQIIDHEDSSL